MTTAAIVSLIAIAAALVLAVRGLRGHGLSFERGAIIATAWVLIIAALAFVLSRVGV